MRSDASPINRLELALALAQGPVPVDDLFEWGLARPGEVVRWLDDGRARGVVAEGDAGRGHFALSRDAAARALGAATVEDFRALALRPALVPGLLAAARRSAGAAGARMAAEVYRAVFEDVPPESFPGGARGFVTAVVESVRLYRGLYGVIGGVMDRAAEQAALLGDLEAQAVLLAARGAAVIRGHVPGDARADLARARDAAEAVGGRARVEVLLYSAVSLVFAGRLREGVAAFEELLGDVPEDLDAPANQPLVDPATSTPAAGLCILAIALSGTGRHPRAIELLHRLLAHGQRVGSDTMVAEARLFLALLNATRGDIEAARGHAEAAFAWYGSAEAEPLYAWFAGIAWASVLVADGRFGEARAAFAAAAEGWRRAGAPPITGPAPFDIADALARAGEPWPDGFDPAVQADRLVALPYPLAAGLGHRLLAGRMAREARTDAEIAAVAAHYERAIALLEEAGAIHDLARARREAAALGGGSPEPARLTPADGETARLLAAVLDLGRLPLRGGHEGLWGAIAARLCEAFSAERCALVDAGEPTALLAARGGGRDWHADVLALARGGGPPEIAVDDARVVVPFVVPALSRRGLAVLETPHLRPPPATRDPRLLDALAVQLGILFGNLALWQELGHVRERLEQENRYFRETRPTVAPGAHFVAHSPAMGELLGLVARVAPSTAGVLIHGETGVGKELVAHEVHRQSPRRDGPFIAVHVASLAPGLVASGLFGHERGAFTGATERTRGRFELADGGTLFLDEVGELSLDDQVRLLRVLQEGTFERVGGCRPIRSDFRLVAATNRDLRAEVRAGRFREDLYFRLSTFPLRVPPLRERREEIPTIALYFMERAGRRRGVRFEGIGEADMARLVAWPWPGNVRELEHLVERAVLLSEPPRLRIPRFEEGALSAARREPPEAPAELVTLAEAERRHVRAVLLHTRGRVTGAGGAAEILGMKPSTLNFRIRRLGLEEELRTARRR